MKPTLHFLGTGGAFDVEAGNSAAVVTLRGRKLLVDCGNTVYLRLRQLNLVDEIDAVLITHLHDDHAGSLSTLLFHRHFFTPDRKLTLLVPDANFREELDRFLAAMMQQPSLYFHYADLHEWEGLASINTTGYHVEGMTSYAYTFADAAYPDDTIVFSGDIGDAHFLFRIMDQWPQKPGVVFHDVSLFPNIQPHAFYGDVAPYLDRYNVVGYHHDHRFNTEENPIPLAAMNPDYLL